MTDEEWEKIEQEWRDEDAEDDAFHKGIMIFLLIPVMGLVAAGIFYAVKLICA